MGGMLISTQWPRRGAAGWTSGLLSPQNDVLEQAAVAAQVLGCRL